jgi:uncharacterized protein with ParB-like and HNH nuclease domain
MEAKEKKLLPHILYSIGNFIIPVYQRNYDWNIGNCSILFNDIISLLDNQQEHFCGSIVSVYDNENRIIIDGQQRITTISLLLIALYRSINTDDKELNTTKKRIIEDYLTNRHEETEKLKLKVSQNNKEHFNSLFETDIEELKNRKSKSRIYENFLFFYDQIQKNNLDLQKLFEAIKRLVVVDILLKQDNNPQLIFETLNSTGKDLEQADLVRNFLLMNLDNDTQNKYYNNYWGKIENNINGLEFFRNFLFFKKPITTSIKDERIYYFFKDIYKSVDKETILKELLEYSDYYRQIYAFTLFNNKIISQKLENIISGSFLDYGVVLPFLFWLIVKHKENKLNINEIAEILDILESYLFRRFVCGLKTSDLQKHLIVLGKNIDELTSKNNASILDAFVYLIAQKGFPNDALFKDRFVTFEFYKNRKSSKQIQHIFLEIEKQNNKEIVTTDLSIEHIAPQTLNTKWRQYLGGDFEKIKDEYLHTIGNLTLTGYNSELSNNLFDIKKREYKNSNIQITRDICGYEKWDLKSIKNRADKLLEQSLKIWKYPVVKKELFEDIENDKLTLSDEINWTGIDINQYTFNGKIEMCRNYRDMYCSIIKILYDYDSQKFVNKILQNEEFKSHISYNNDKFKNLANKELYDFYININKSHNNFIDTLRKIIDILDFDEITCDSFEFKSIVAENELIEE